MSNDIKKLATDNPLIDEIVYQCQVMIKELVLKDEERANENETIASIQNSDLYADILSGNITYSRFTYEFRHFRKLTYLNSALCRAYARDNGIVPEPIQQDVLKIRSDEFMENYEDQNNYYRMLNGLPDVDETGIYLTQDLLDMIDLEEFDNTLMVHEMDENQIDIIDLFGVLDVLKEKYPEKKYLWHLGKKRIDPHVARRALPFSILYIPSTETMEVTNKFIERLEINRVYILKTVYSEAYKFRSKYYDRMIMMMIVLQSIDDMVTLAPEYIIRRDLFDMRTIEYVFNACGVDFFPEIPLKYQKRLVKNLNRLIKYKSTDKNLIDISALFGFDNIELFKYYLLKLPLLDENGEYMDDVIEDPETGDDVDNVDANYELQFLKVPFDGNFDETIRDRLNYYNYDEFVKEDLFWDGIYDHEIVKHQILEEEFNLVITKYISVQSTYSVAEMSFQMAYFINMLLYSKIDLKQLTLQVPEISSTMNYNLVDLIIFLYSMMYLYNETQDNIIYDPVQAMDVKGFNFETDMAKLAEYVEEKGFTLEELGVDGFMNPKAILTFNQLIEVYTNNKKIYDHLVDQMNNANDKDIYDIYRTIYESLYITRLNFDYFKTNGGKQSKTYKEFLANKCASLYTIVMQCAEITKPDERRAAIAKYINYVADNIYIYIDSEEFRYIFMNIPTLSLDYIRQYLMMVVNFFKSYKVDLILTNNIYLFDDRLENKIMIIDKIILEYIYNKTEFIESDDFMKLKLNPIWKSGLGIEDVVYLDITRWKRLFPRDYYPLFEYIAKVLITTTKSDNIKYDDIIAGKTYMYDKADMYKLLDGNTLKLSMSLSDNCGLDDHGYIDYE